MPSVEDAGEMTVSDTGINWNDCGGRTTVIGNAVPGSEGMCFQASQGWCVPPRQFANNSGHGCLVGFGAKGAVSQEIQDITLWQIRHIGIWGCAQSVIESSRRSLGMPSHSLTTL